MVIAILVLVGAAAILSAPRSHAETAAADCLAKPNAAPPSGSHWYYRVDRASNRHCWYLGPEGAKARQAKSESPKPRPAPKDAEIAAPALRPAAPPQMTLPTMTGVEPAARATAIAAALAPPLPTSTDAFDREPAVITDGAAGEAAAPATPAAAPAPALTAQQPAAPPQLASTSTLALALAGAAAVPLLVVMASLLRRSLAARRLRRRRMALREQWAELLQSSQPSTPAPAGTATRPDAHGRKAPSPVASARAAPARPREDTAAGEAHDIEQRLQRLLHDWQRAAA
jgi:hypothetical protein